MAPIPRKLMVPPGYIEGLNLVWESGSSLRVTSGVAFVPAYQGLLEVSADVVKSALTFAANTWYFVYLFENAGTVDVELIPYTPAMPNVPAIYRGTARQKPGDPSRRYLGAIRSNGAATPTIIPFWRDGLFVRNLDVPYRVLSGGNATVRTAVSLADAIPPLVRLANIGIYCSANIGTNISVPGSTATSIYYQHGIAALIPVETATDATQRIEYANVAAGGGTFIDVYGYYESR